MKFALVVLLSAAAWGADFRAGAARVDITPEGPIWLSGYGARTHPSEGVLMHIWAKALAIEDRGGTRTVIITTDLIGLPRSMTDVVAARLQKDADVDRAHLLLNSSHTHTGPMVRGNLLGLADLGPEDQRRIDEYGARLTDNLVAVAEAALGKLEPVELSYGFGQAHFGANRRVPKGPVDPEVPVIAVKGTDGKLRAVLFGYACHNTTLTGQFYQISGDYAGFAQKDIEEANPGAVALFMMLCGADTNPNPRSKLELAEKYGADLAAEVGRVMRSGLKPLKGRVRAAYNVIDLAFAVRTREDFEQEAKSTQRPHARRAELMLRAYDERRPVLRTPYPIQALRFGKDLTLLALGGEVVVDYDLRVKREYGPGVVVAGYSNDVMSYIPSMRVLHEGGYEAVDSMMPYGQPGPYADDVEERIFTGIHQVMKRVGVTAVH